MYYFVLFLPLYTCKQYCPVLNSQKCKEKRPIIPCKSMTIFYLFNMEYKQLFRPRIMCLTNFQSCCRRQQNTIFYMFWKKVWNFQEWHFCHFEQVFIIWLKIKAHSVKWLTKFKISLICFGLPQMKLIEAGLSLKQLRDQILSDI